MEKVASQAREGDLPGSRASDTGADKDSGADKEQEDAGDQDKLDEASNMLQGMSFESAPPQNVCNSELSEHAVTLMGICRDSTRIHNWVSASLARLQASKLQVGF